MSNTIGAVIIGRDDSYGANLHERASYALNSLIYTFDEVIFVDWGGRTGISLVERIYDNLIESDKLKVITITPDMVNEFTRGDPQAQTVCEVLAKNIGIRRLSTDFILSTGLEDICPRRMFLDPLNDQDVFYIGARRNTPLENVTTCGGYKDFPQVQDKLYVIKDRIFQEGSCEIYPGDKWSTIANCGDFQFASKKVWYGMKGFEESLIYRGFMDTNTIQKAILSGFRKELRNELPVFHIQHEGGFGGSGGINSRDFIRNFTQTNNKDTWGFSDMNLEMIPMKELRK